MDHSNHSQVRIRGQRGTTPILTDQHPDLLKSTTGIPKTLHPAV
jgi:hypothetical protein